MKKYLFLSILTILSWWIFSLYNGYIWFVYPDREKYPILGIDVSHYQWDIDWKKVKEDGVWFAYIKGTEGDDWVDDAFDKNYTWAKKSSLPVWMYHFYSLRISPEKQLENLTKVLSWKVFDLPIVIDLEFLWNSKVRPEVDVFQKDLQEFIFWVKSLQKWRKPILYTTNEFKEQYLAGNTFYDYSLWIRDIVRSPIFDNWTIWQYKNRWHISWIRWFVDFNVLSGSLDSLYVK